MSNMAAVTTHPGFDAPVVARHLSVVRDATPRTPRASRATYRRRRLLACALVLGAVVVAGEAGSALGGSPLATPERRPTLSNTVVVQQGDTLWSLVQRAEPTADPRPIVDALSEARDGAPLVPGETIRLPE
jgi:hypothetical protein